MSLDKAIQAGKEKRKPYRGSKAFDYSCRNHGSCGYCLNSRMYSTKRQYGRVEDQEQEFFAAVAGYDEPDGLDESEELMERFGFDPNDPHDMVHSGMFYNHTIEQELRDAGEEIL